MKYNIRPISDAFGLLYMLLIIVQISEARETVSELVSRLEPQLRERAAEVRRLAVPLSDSDFQKLLTEVVTQRIPVHAESETCRSDSQLVVNAIMKGKTWALRMFDASTKLPNGLLDGHLVDLGHFHECIETAGPKNLFNGQHCLVETRGILPPELHRLLNFDLSDAPPDYNLERWIFSLDLIFSVCVPSSCSARDVQVHMDHVLAPINASSVLYDNNCSTTQPLPYRIMDYFAISVFLGILTVVVCSTAKDVLSSGHKSDVVVAFSVVRNWRELVDTKAGNSASDISCLHGLRVISTAGIVLAHRVTSTLLNVSIPVIPGFEMLDTVMVAVCENLLRGVDVYFMIGGTVRAYGFFRDRYKGRRLDILPSIGRRYLRYTPTLAIVMLYTATLLIHSSSGPMWSRSLDYTTWCCRNNWLTGVLHISNYVYPLAACTGESWYLAADFHLFTVAPLFLIPLYFRPRLGISLLTLAGLGCMAVYVFTSYILKIDACSFLLKYNRKNEFITGLYFQTHLRAPSYLLGLGLGYFLFTVTQSNKRIKISKVVLWMGWLISLVSLAFLVVTTKIILDPDYQYTPWLDIYHNAFSKLQVAAVGAWVVLVCTQGYGGIVNDFLSWRGFQPLARLALGVYLVHFGLLVVPLNSRQTAPVDVDQVTILYLWLGDLVIATIIAVPLYLCVELPSCKLASKYLVTPVPYDPITASITAKKLKQNNSTKTYQPAQPGLETSSQKVKKKNKK